MGSLLNSLKSPRTPSSRETSPKQYYQKPDFKSSIEKVEPPISTVRKLTKHQKILSFARPRDCGE